MGREVIRGYIDERSAKIARVVSSRFVNRRAYEQVVKLRSGVTVKVSVGGCDHFGIRFSFGRIAGLTRDTPPRELVRIARDSVGALPIRKADEVWLADLKTALAAQAAALDMQPLASGHTFACGEFKTCELIVPRPGVLEVSYSFAL